MIIEGGVLNMTSRKFETHPSFQNLNMIFEIAIIFCSDTIKNKL